MSDRENIISIYENCILNDKQCCANCYTGGPGLGIACREKILSDALALLKELKPKKGKWKEQEDYNGDTYYDCSVCGESWTTIDGTPWQNGMNYCPHCGADMR